ncbi:unnamed protein product [Angiostrongylus costaricensis]|uniref:Uncharacterized protein n=1 Tax=Angiostrongylus costaricensis TaxID=334426 RepID=A0A0R3PPS3_ANGCS|nr:unnamed protein product [Angiostrongylus costaricensis]
MKYEHILQLPARKVNEFLAKESEKPSKIVKEESEEVLEGIEFERKNKAATVIQRTLAAYRAARERDAAAFAKRQLIIQSMKRDIAVLNSIKPGMSVTPSLLKRLGSTRPLSDYKASINHEEEMEKIESSLLDLNI